MTTFGETWRRWSWPSRLSAAAFIAYTLIHVGYAGVWKPLTDHLVIQTAQEVRPLKTYFRTGRPVRLDPNNPRQYGPAYLFLMHPILRLSGGPDLGYLDLAVPSNPRVAAVSRCLYVAVVPSLVLAAWFVASSLRVWLAAWRPGAVWAAIATTVLLTANFSPLYEILDIKNVEAWEVCLIAAGMYAHVRGRSLWAGVCIAAATLMKILPGFFFVYLLLRDRKAFLYGCASVAAILLAAHAIYGPELGLRYPLLPVKAVTGPTMGFTGHANMSMKGMIAKALGHLQTPEAPLPEHPWQDGDPRSGYYVALTPGQLRLANALGNVWQVALVAWFIWVLAGTRHRPPTVYRRLWEWALADLVMLLVTPLIGYEYSLLVLPAFCVACAVAVATPDLMPGWGVRVVLFASVFMVANIIPRQIVQRIIPVRMFGRWSGYTHLLPTELYNHYGFAMAGLVLLLAVLWAIRPARIETRLV